MEVEETEATGKQHEAANSACVSHEGTVLQTTSARPVAKQVIGHGPDWQGAGLSHAVPARQHLGRQ